MLADVLKRIGKHTLIYGLGNIMTRVTAFFMIPIYTNYLSPTDYGVIDLLDLSSYLLGIILTIGMSSTVLRFYYEYQDARQRNLLISTALGFVSMIEVLALVVLGSLSEKISGWVFQTVRYRDYFKVIFVTMCFGIMIDLVMTYLRAKQRSLGYTLLSVAWLVLGLTLNIYLIVVLKKGIWGVLVSGVVSSGAIALVVAAATLREVGVGFSWSLLKPMVSYGAPLILSSLGMFVVTFGGRVFVQRMAGLAEVGIYSLGYKIGMGISVLVVTPFLLFWFAYMDEIAKRDDGREMFARIWAYFGFILGVLSLGLCLLGGDLVRMLTPRDYWRAAVIVPIIALAYFILGVNYFFHIGMNLAKRTGYLAYSLGGGALVSLTLNYILVQRHGAVGAAVATLLSFGVMAVANYYFSQRLYRVDYQYSRMARMVGVGLVLFFVSQILPLNAGFLGMGIRVALWLSFPLVLGFMDFYTAEEVELSRVAARYCVERVRDFVDSVAARRWVSR